MTPDEKRLQRGAGPGSCSTAVGSAPRGPTSTGARGSHIEQGGPQRGVRPGRRPCGPTSSATPWSARRSSSGAPRSRSRSSCPKILKGEIAWCQGFSEPDAGSRPGLAQDQGRARRRRVGDQRPEGVDHPGPVRRLHLPAGPHRPRRDKHAGISYLLVPMRQAGIEVRPIKQIDGSAEFNEVFFSGARCPKENVVGGRQQRLDGGHDHARLRAGHVGHHRVPAVRAGAGRDHREAAAPTAGSTTRASARVWPAPGPRSRSWRSTASAASADARRDPTRRRRPRGQQQDVLVRDAPRRHGPGHRHPGHGRPDPHGGRRRRGRAGHAAGAGPAGLPGERRCRPRSSSPGRRRSGAGPPRSSATSWASGCSACPRSPRRPPSNPGFLPSAVPVDRPRPAPHSFFEGFWGAGPPRPSKNG